MMPTPFNVCRSKIRPLKFWAVHSIYVIVPPSSCLWPTIQILKNFSSIYVAMFLFLLNTRGKWEFLQFCMFQRVKDVSVTLLCYFSRNHGEKSKLCHTKRSNFIHRPTNEKPRDLIWSIARIFLLDEHALALTRMLCVSAFKWVSSWMVDNVPFSDFLVHIFVLIIDRVHIPNLVFNFRFGLVWMHSRILVRLPFFFISSRWRAHYVAFETMRAKENYVRYSNAITTRSLMSAHRKFSRWFDILSLTRRCGS